MVEHITPLARQLLAGDIQDLETFMVRNGFSQPQVIRAPFSTSLPCSKIRYAYHYWKTLRPRGGLPGRRQLIPDQLGIALGNICLLELLHEGRDIRYRLFGSNVAQEAGFDLQGLTMKDIPRRFPRRNNSDMAFHLAVYQSSLRDRLPYYSSYVIKETHGRAGRAWHRLSMPLLDDRGDCSLLLLCVTSHPLPPRPVTTAAA